MGEVGLKTPNKPPTQRSCRPDDRHDHPSAAARGIAARRRSNRVPRTRSERRDAGRMAIETNQGLLIIHAMKMRQKYRPFLKGNADA
jgi:hypothetical protein